MERTERFGLGEDEEEASGDRETSVRREPIMSGPEPSPDPAVSSQSQPMRTGEPSCLRPSAGFGRFQAL
jgi:hypothetical protein